jgi:hypothetical protein
MRNPLLSTVQFLFVVAILLLGGFLMVLPSAPAIRFRLAQTLTDNSFTLFAWGLLVFTLGFLLLASFYVIDRKQFLQVKMGGVERHTIIEEGLIKDYIENYWSALFPNSPTKCLVIVHPDQKLELIVNLPTMSDQECQAVLKRIEKEVSHLLAHKLGYLNDFILTLTLK